MRIKTFFSSAFAAFLIAAGAYNSNAQSIAPANDVPRTISYQGTLADNYGKALPDGSYRITLSLFVDPAGSVMVWQDTYDALVINGIFNLYLGTGNNPLPDPAKLNTALWIGTQVGDAPLMHPLTPLSASPYALNVPDRAITTGKLADGAVTAEKVDMDYIAGLQINDRQIAGTGTVLKLKGSDAITLDYDETTNSVTIGAGNGVEKGTSGDDEKGAAVQDNTDGSNNWLGRDAGTNQPSFSTPVGTYNTLAGGRSNIIATSNNYSGIAAGYNNTIGQSSLSGFIGGGEGHSIGSSSSWATIGGGQENSVGNNTQWVVIAGGHGNDATAHHATIGGGHENSISGTESTIGGGWQNIILGTFSTIAGGEGNSAPANHTSIGGGEAHSAEGHYSSMPGGDHLKTTGYAHNAVGFYNAPRGFLASIPTTAAKATNNDPLFMVGNGTPTTAGGTPTRSNAFEVSYNGHSVVYDVNGATRTPIKGATYVDNVVYAWGDINANGTINSEFGISSVTYMGAGTYLIRIEVNDPITGAPVTLNNASITTTAIQEGVDPGWLCFTMTTTRIGNPGPNQFIVRVKNSTTCAAADTPFMFKVTGRP